MTRQEIYTAIERRIQDPRNAALLAKQDDKKVLNIRWHQKRAKNMLVKLEEKRNPLVKLHEISFDVSVHHILHVMEKENWF